MKALLIKCKIQLPVFSCCFTWAFTSVDIIFYKFFRTSVNIFWKKNFVTDFPFFPFSNPQLLWVSTTHQEVILISLFYGESVTLLFFFFIFFFFNCYLAVPRPTLGHFWGDSLPNPMLITAFLLTRPEGHREPRNSEFTQLILEVIVTTTKFKFWILLKLLQNSSYNS